ncbi:hypothetical protein HUJ05_009734 [Dendroctonus ponderosae]|nr:hypothetical protein HUJ05_009734 [Dendroctonus ponderosae]
MAWNELRTNLLNAAEEALERRTKTRTGKRNTKPWFKQEVKNLAAEKRKAYLQYRSNTITYEVYKAVRNRVNAEIQSIKRQHWEKLSADMEHDLYGGQKRIWNMLRNRKRPVNEYIQITKITTEDWEKHFEQLYRNKEENTETKETPTNEETPPTWQIPIEEIKQTATALKKQKITCIDEITNEMIKYGGNALMDELKDFYNKILYLQKVPSEWKDSITIPIFKKGEKTEPKNYRGITLHSTVSKLLTKILAEEVTNTGICEEQQGFRHNRSTIDAILTLRQIAEKAIEFNKPAFMCFIDLSQAFDKVRLTDVIKLLEERKIHQNIVSIIRELNTGNHTLVKAENRTTRRIPVNTGIRQGDSLSPILFNIIMDEIITKTK